LRHLLDNIAWHTLTGQHAHHAAGAGDARRYAEGFSPIVGFRDAAQPDFAALAPYCVPGDHFYCGGWSGAAPADWRIDADTTMFNMVWEGGVPEHDEAPEALPLGPAHVPQVLALAALTRPGPFGPRTIELGEYFGIFEGGELVAMAGERFHAGSLHEISGVCTEPGHQGRGLARRLVSKLVRRQALRGETSFLHVMRDNTNARALYRRMGFRDHAERAVRLVTRTS
jgi:ribosomal protein S18 acetylase RimI-like enzyme